jgi:uncharacterized protein YgiM (DUF1202 family)
LGSGPIRFKVVAFLLLIAAGSAAYYHFAYRSRHIPAAEAAYVLPNTLEVVDTPAEVHLVIDSLKSGDRVEVLARTTNWAKVGLADGHSGWVEAKDLLDDQTYEAGQRLLQSLAGLPVQAVGRTSGPVNLRIEPSREAAQLTQLAENREVDVFGRRVVERPPQPDQPRAAGVREAWYMVRAGSWAGWLLGRFVSLDIPAPLSMYAQGTNMVAWLVLNTVADGGQQVPQYLVADRVGTQDVDFNHIRVFTWWVKDHKYATAYVESGLSGEFPIRVTSLAGVPYFRLRLTDQDGRKFQKVYGLFDTITRPLGTVDGWESDALPARSAPRHRRRW